MTESCLFRMGWARRVQTLYARFSQSRMFIFKFNQEHRDICYRCVRNKRRFGDVKPSASPTPPELNVGNVPVEVVNIGAK